MLKSNIAWMKKNVPSDLKVWKGMIQDIDWSQVAAKTKLSLQRDKDRITAEFKEFAAMDTSAKIDWLMNGDRHLGYLYKKDAIAFARREWKGLKSVGYDFVGWLKIWGGMLNMVMKDPMSIMLAVFEYHWFASYLATPAVVDRSVFGRRGKLLQADFDMWVAITHWAEDLIANLIMADAKIGGNQKINKRIIMFDEMTMAQMMAGFPNLLGIPYQMIPVFMVSEMDQLTLIPYIDAIESYGLPSDTCPLPTAECGCAVKDEYPMCGQGFIASSMPCDGSVMATSFQDRRFSKFMPSYPLCMPVRYDDEDTTEMAAADMKDCIHWVEGLTGETWNWDTYFATMEKMNECTRNGRQLHRYSISHPCADPKTGGGAAPLPHRCRRPPGAGAAAAGGHLVRTAGAVLRVASAARIIHHLAFGYHANDHMIVVILAIRLKVLPFLSRNEPR